MNIHEIADSIDGDSDILGTMLVESVVAGDNRNTEVILEELRRWVEAATIAKKKGNLTQTEDELIAIAKSIDPTAELSEPYKYVDWILRMMKPITGGQAQLILTDKEDLERLHEALSKYELYKPVAQKAVKSKKAGETPMTSVKVGDEVLRIANIDDVASLSPNIGNYRTINDLYNSVRKVEEGLGLISSESQESISINFNILPGTTIVGESDNFILIEITDAGSCFEYGRGTRWCTAGSKKTAASYIEQGRGAIFQIWKKPEPKQEGDVWRPRYQFQPDFSQFKNTSDADAFGGAEDEVKKLVTPSVDDAKRSPHRIIGYAQKLGRRLAGLEPEIIKNARCAAMYAAHIIKERWMEAESIIFSNPMASAIYANQLLFKLIGKDEANKLLSPILPKIKINPAAARTLVKPLSYIGPNGESILASNRWEEAEPYILKDLNQATEYFKEHIKEFPGNRWEMLFNKIAGSSDPNTIVSFATTVIGKRIPDLEPVILQDVNAALTYMKDLAGWSNGNPVWPNRKWLQLEQTILEHPDRADWMYKYATIINNRWPEAEKYIINNLDVAVKYYQYTRPRFENSRWSLLEKSLLELGKSSTIAEYAIQLTGRWPEAESFIIKDSDSAISYAGHVGRFPLGDALFINIPLKAFEYIKASGPTLDRSLGKSQFQPWPEFEEKIADNADYSLAYAKLIRKRFRAGESAIARDPKASVAYIQRFSDEFRGNRWPEFEQAAMINIDKHPNLIAVYMIHTGYTPKGALEQLAKHPVYYNMFKWHRYQMAKTNPIEPSPFNFLPIV